MGKEKQVRYRGNLPQTRIATESGQSHEEQREFLDREGWSDVLQINEDFKKGKERERERAKSAAKECWGQKKQQSPIFNVTFFSASKKSNDKIG